MTLTFYLQERTDSVCLIGGEQAACGQCFAAQAALFVAPTVNERIARGTTPSAWGHADADE